MKVDRLSNEDRALAILDWFEFVHGDRDIMVCVKSYYDADQIFADYTTAIGTS